MNKLFGTDGIRGKANTYPITAELALKLGKGIAHLFRQDDRRHRIIIGKDSRLSGYILEHALVSGICSMGLNAIIAGTMTTSGIAYLTHSMRADAGIMISASHNPFDDNGIKIFDQNGFKLTPNAELEIENFILNSKIKNSEYPKSKDLGRAIRLDNARGMYIGFLKSHFPKKYDLKGFKIAIDCANGASFKIAPDIFSDLGAEVKSLSINPNGININDNCGSQHPNNLRKLIINEKFDIGFAFDGDADRVIAIDEFGNIITGDQIIAICAKFLKENGLLKNNTVVSTIMSNYGFRIAMKELSIKNIVADVGDSKVLEKMIETGAILGGEDSGHIIFLDHHTTGDGILTAIQLLLIMLSKNKSLSELSKIMKIYPSKLINIEVNDRVNLDSIPELTDIIKCTQDSLKSDGRVLVRYSQTQPLCRIFVEAPSQDEAENYCKDIAEIIRKNIGTKSKS
ncbi:MAG: phosphoglucosamine mutase [Promethearchaeota archaeon]